MTRVKMLYDENIPIGFEMIGHANYGPPNLDILCASLSATSQMTINGLVEWLGIGCEDLVVEQNQLWGVLKVRVPDEMHYKMMAQCLLRSFEVYIEMLSKEYPKYVKYERSEINGE